MTKMAKKAVKAVAAKVAEQPFPRVANTFDLLTREEIDHRNGLLNELLNVPHGDLIKSQGVHSKLAEYDPYFYAKLASWYALNGKVRDHNEIFAVNLLIGAHANRATGEAALMRLAPYQVANVIHFVRKPHKRKGKPVAALKRSTRQFQAAIKRYVQELVNTPARLEGAVKTSKRTVHWLVTWTHTKPTALAQALLFDSSAIKPDTPAWAIRELAKRSDAERAMLIRQHKLPFVTASGALGSEGMGAETLRALIENMTPQEVLNMASRLESYGIANDPIAAKAFAEKLAVAPSNTRTNAAKMTLAAERVKDSAMREAIEKTQARVFAESAKGAGAGLRIVVGADVSASMHHALEVMARTTALVLMAYPEADVRAYAFDSFAFRIDANKGDTWENIKSAALRYRGGGNTSMAAVLEACKADKWYPDVAVWATDEGENNGIAARTQKSWVDAGEVCTSHIILRVDGNDQTLSRNLKEAGYEVSTFDLNSLDYNALNNVIPLIKAGARGGLLRQVYDTPMIGTAEFAALDKGK